MRSENCCHGIMEISDGIVCSEMHRLHHELLLHQGLRCLLDGVRGTGGCGVQGHQQTLQRFKRWVVQSRNTWWEVECMGCSCLFPLTQIWSRIKPVQQARLLSAPVCGVLQQMSCAFPSGSSGHFPGLPSEPFPSTAREPFFTQQEWHGTKGFLNSSFAARQNLRGAQHDDNA